MPPEHETHMPPQTSTAPDTEHSTLACAALAASWVLAWLLTHRNFGMYDDAVLYTLQALSRIDPTTYGRDLFFRFGSQDSFTIFTALYAQFIKHLGVTAASAVLVLALSASFYLAAWFLARQLMPARLASLGVGLLIVIPAHYGAFQIFKVAEEFVTARLPAEAVLLAAVAAFLRSDRVWAWLLVLLGGLLHPLMTIPVAVILALLSLPGRQMPRVLAAAAVAMAVACLVAVFSPIGPVVLMDAEWLEIVRLRSSYLFPEHWPVRSIERLVLVLTTLWFMHAASGDAALRRLVHACGSVCIGGLLATMVTQFIPVVIVMQVQPWRALWIVTVLSILLLPSLVATLWGGDRAAKSAAVLISCAWLLQDVSTHTVALAPLALGLWMVPQSTRKRFDRYFVALAALVAAITVAWTAGTAFSALAIDLGFRQEHAVVERLRTMFGLVSAAVGYLLVAWLLVTRPRTGALRGAAALGLLVVSLPLIGSAAWGQWIEPAARKDAPSFFDDWKRVVPRGAEVMWLWDPVSTWMLLERPSYLSYAQASGVVFSRDTALALARRAQYLRPVAAPEFTLGAVFQDDSSPKPLTLPSLRAICADPDLGFVVSEDDVGVDAPSKEWPTRGRFIYLYDCEVLRIGRES